MSDTRRTEDDRHKIILYADDRPYVEFFVEDEFSPQLEKFYTYNPEIQPKKADKKHVIPFYVGVIFGFLYFFVSSTVVDAYGVFYENLAFGVLTTTVMFIVLAQTGKSVAKTILDKVYSNKKGGDQQ